MKLSKTTAGALVALLAAGAIATEAAAKSFAQGLACPSQNDGTPLVGAIFVSFTQTFGGTGPTPCNQPTQVEAMVRLAHGKTLRAYFTAVQVPTDVCNPCTVMDALLHDAFLIEQIQNDFCAGSNCTIGVRQVSSVGSDEELSADGTTKYYRTLADVTVSAH